MASRSIMWEWPRTEQLPKLSRAQPGHFGWRDDPCGRHTGVGSNQTYTIEIFANDACHPMYFGGGKTFLGSFSVTTDSNGVVIFDEEIAAGVTEPFGVSATATGANGTSEFSYCRPLRHAEPELGPGTDGCGVDSQTEQFITDIFQEKWFKFPVQPGSTVTVKLTSLPGSAVSLHRDPYPIYNALIDPENAA